MSDSRAGRMMNCSEIGGAFGVESPRPGLTAVAAILTKSEQRRTREENRERRLYKERK